MGNCDNRAAEILKIVLENGQRGNVKVIGRLVKKQDIRGSHEDLQKVEPLSFAAGELFDAVPLKLGREQEAFEHLRSRYCPVRSSYDIGSLADILNDLHSGVHRFAFLREIAYIDRITDSNCARIRREHSGKHFQERAFALAVPANDTYSCIAGNETRKVRNEQLSVYGFCNVFNLNGLSAETRRYGL